MVQTEEEIKEYRHNYYLCNKAVYRQRYVAWCETNPNKSREKRGPKKTPEELKAYRHQYYLDHKKRYLQNYREWCETHKKSIAASNKRWHDNHPTYYKNYMRKRVAIIDPFIFQFLDGGYGRSIEDYVDYLREQGVPEQHINWFKTDVKVHISSDKNNGQNT